MIRSTHKSLKRDDRPPPGHCFLEAIILPNLSELDRGFYKALRIVSRSLYALAQLLAALMALPRSHSKAAENLLQAYRNCGIAQGILAN